MGYTFNGKEKQTMEWTFGYGTTQQKVEIPEQNVLGVLRANPMHHERIGSAAVAYAMEHPIGAARLRELVKPEQKIAIIASDISRPVPSWEILPIIVEELLTAGCQKENITVVFALGAHRPHTQKERRHLAGSVYDMVRCVDSDPMDCLHMGVTKRGTPVDIASGGLSRFSNLHREHRISLLCRIFRRSKGADARGLYPGGDREKSPSDDARRSSSKYP